MNLCKMLKKTKSELLMQMGSKELTQWMAFNALEDKEYKEKLEIVVKEEDLKTRTNEQEANEMRRMLMGIING